MKYTRKSLAKKLGIGAETLRYYEKIDLIPPAVRESNGYRVYTEEDALHIEHIIMAKKFGFSLGEIKAIMGKFKNNKLGNEEMVQIFSEKIKDIDKRIIELKELKTLLINGLKSYRE